MPQSNDPNEPNTESQPRHRLARLRGLGVPLQRFGRWFSYQPRWFRVGFLVVLAIGIIASTAYSRIYLKKRESERATATAWQAYNDAANKTNLDAMRAALDRLLEANPADANALRFRDMLDRGEAAPDAPEMALVLMTHHLAAGRIPEAGREAEKALAKYPKHWQARCTLAHFALRVQHDPARAEQILSELPDPEDPAANVRLAGILHALQLFDAIGRDATPLHSVIVRKLVPLTRSSAAANAEPTAKAQLIACYLEPFADSSSLSELGSYWGNVDKLAEDATTGAIATGDVTTLVRLGELGLRMRIALAMLRNSDPARLPPERFQPLLNSIDERTRRAFQAVREKEPQRPEPYRGLARLALQNGDHVAAIQAVLDGLTACGDRPEFLEMLVSLVTRFGTDDTIRKLADNLWKSAQDAKTDPVKWCLAANIALVLERTDRALFACKMARANNPAHPWACATEARIHVHTGNFFAAREALAPLGEAALLVNPPLTRLHARILVGSGLWVLRDDDFKKVTEAQAKLKPKTSLPAVAFLLGVLDAPSDDERAAWVAAKAELVLANDPSAPGAVRVRAEAMIRLAELSVVPHPEDPSKPPVWNPQRVAAALRAVNELPPEQRAAPEVIAAVATLQLKGEGNATAAFRTAAPLLAMQAMATAYQLEVLGTVLLAHDRLAEALQVLQRAAKFPRPSAGCLVALALAYQKNGQHTEAWAALRAAENTPNRSDREQAEMITAKFQLLKEKR